TRPATSSRGSRNASTHRRRSSRRRGRRRPWWTWATRRSRAACTPPTPATRPSAPCSTPGGPGWHATRTGTSSASPARWPRAVAPRHSSTSRPCGPSTTSGPTRGGDPTVLYVLTRTSKRPRYFAALRANLAAQGVPFVHVVHSDEPTDAYVAGDIVVRGDRLPPAKVKCRSDARGVR